ncbi:hypothetical protein BCR39DRAFT_562114 [Naematelia encephala]|uniref:Uncharacterized protein n=1 Tax=Naematelia encephala TaxID=71784 RepID=A0A1Y2AKN7_9TREE|nr:hypothetical protein BCR39DRAFT_562114 [Naematelia encephala]
MPWDLLDNLGPVTVSAWGAKMGNNPNLLYDDLAKVIAEVLLVNPTKRLLQRFRPTAAQARSYPSLCPAMIAGPNRNQAMRAIVDERVQSSEDFIDGYTTWFYEGDPSLEIPVEFGPENGTIGWPATVQTALVTQLRAILTHQADSIYLEVVQRVDAVRCHVHGPLGVLIVGLSTLKTVGGSLDKKLKHW